MLRIGSAWLGFEIFNVQPCAFDEFLHSFPFSEVTTFTLKYKAMLPGRMSFSLLCVFILALASCSGTRGSKGEAVDITIIQLNDVYEIAPVDGGRYGGMARVAHVIREEKEKNPNTLAVVAGDFLSPSLLGTLKLNGKRISGMQMIEVFNAAGIDLVTFGNHEFDLKRDALQERIYASEFEYTTANVFQKAGNDTLPFQEMKNGRIVDIPSFVKRRFSNAEGHVAELGIFGVTLPFTRKDWVVYAPVEEKIREMLDSLQSADAVLAITHLDYHDDTMYARKYPRINLIIGGHDHEHMFFDIQGTLLAKADANARSIYIHRIRIDAGGRVDIHSELKVIDEHIVEDTATLRVVKKWLKVQDEIFRKMNVDPNEVLMTAPPEGLDGLEATVRNRPSNLAQLIAKAMLKAVPGAEAAILNSGSIRVDDVLRGEITQYDVLRTLPYGGAILKVKIKGELLEKVLNVGRRNRGNGGYLQWANISADSRRNLWMIKGEPIDKNRVYTIAMPAFLLSGMESNLGFLNRENKDIVGVEEPGEEEMLRKDIRYAVIAYMKELAATEK